MRRATLIVAVAVPLSLLAAGLVLNARGAGFNALTLSGLLMAITILIDDAIIDTDNIRRRLRQRREDGGGQTALAVIVDAAAQTRGPIVYATLIIVLDRDAGVPLAGAVRGISALLAVSD